MRASTARRWLALVSSLAVVLSIPLGGAAAHETDAAPETTITSGPPSFTAGRNATFTFRSDPGGATFSCSLDGAAFETCSSPKNYVNLLDGPHVFRVRAADAAGNVDETPAEWTWTIDYFGPRISVQRPTAGIYMDDEAVLEYGPVIAVFGSVTFSVQIEDESGVRAFEFQIDGKPVDRSKITTRGHTHEFLLEVTERRTYEVTASAVNGSGVSSALAVQVEGFPN